MIIAVIFEFCKWGVAGNLPAEGVGGNEVPTRGRLSPKKSYLRNVQKPLN